jgi:hypothetical protein
MLIVVWAAFVLMVNAWRLLLHPLHLLPHLVVETAANGMALAVLSILNVQTEEWFLHR